MKQATKSVSTSTQKTKTQKPKAKSSSSGTTTSSTKKKQPMIATASAHTTPDSSSLLGGVWIDASSRSTDVDVDTVISELTYEQLHGTNQGAEESKKDDLMAELLKTLNGATGRSTTPGIEGLESTPQKQKASTKKAPPTTPSTAQSTPDKSVATKAKRKSNKSPSSSAHGEQSHKSTSTATATATATGATASTGTSTKTTSNTTTTKQPAAATKPAGRKSPPTPNGNGKPPATPTKKKAPPLDMNVSPNPKVRKPKVAPATSAAAPLPPMPMTTKPAPKSPPPTASLKAPPPTATASLKAPPSPAREKLVPTVHLKEPPAFLNPPPSPSQQNNNLGLSELSKQLRIQRAKNEWQHQEIARLERQIRILSDLKGVSVAELKFSLESACQEEAHGELRNQILSLQAQLEALQMQRDAGRRRASTANHEAATSKIATLQLRIGELEEVDHAKQAEVHQLYQQLQQQASKATALEATSAQQAARINQFEAIAKQYITDVEGITAERDALRQQVAALSQQVQDQKHQQELAQAMKNIEDELDKEKKRKQAYLNQAAARQRAAAPMQQQAARSSGGGPAVNQRLSGSQLAAIQGVVGRQAGVPGGAPLPSAAASIANLVASQQPRGDDSATYSSESVSVVPSNPFDTNDAASAAPSNPFEGLVEDDNVSQLGGDDMSVHTFDALMMQGLTEEQAKEALAKDAKITELYEELRDQATKASQLQTLCANQKMHLDRFAQELNEKGAALKSTQNNYNFAKNEHDSLYQRFCDVELQLRVEQEKVEGLGRQLHARVHESNLRNDQFKCRFQVQNERIADLEQQQSSLYTAFELLQQEVRAQDTEHNKLKSSLDEADSEVARQLRESEQNNNGGRNTGRRSSSRRNLSPDRTPFDSSVRDFDSEFASAPSVTATAVTPYAGMDASSASLYSSRRELTPQQQGIDHPMQMYGYLWKLDKIKGWKRRFFALYGEGGVYQLTYSDGPKERVKGTISNITMGVSTVAETNKSIKKPFSFVLHVDPLQHGAPVLYAAAPDSSAFYKWMNALKAATIRPEDSLFMSSPNLSSEAQLDADMEVARQMSARDLDYNDADAQIEADHLMAMRLSIQNQPNRAYA